MASYSSLRSLGVIVPNNKNLNELKLKFISLGPCYLDKRPIPGNDFHDVPGVIHDGVPWSACLRVDEKGSDTSLVPHVYINQPPSVDEDAAVKKTTEHVIEVIQQLWPDSSESYMDGEMLSLLFETRIFRGDAMSSWLAAQGLTEEAFAMNMISQGPRSTYVPCLEKQSHVVYSGQVWSFIEKGRWVMSFPVIASIMCLLSHPDKGSISEYPDRDMAWCLDSLHAFCRFENTDALVRPLAYSLGTYADKWMYLQFIVHTFSKVDDRVKHTADQLDGSGMLTERRTVTVPDVGSFRESRVWIAVRTIAGTLGPNMRAPLNVTVIVSDLGHLSLDLEDRHWLERGIESPDRIAVGVALFQMQVWSQVDAWYNEWEACVNDLDKALEVEWKDLEDRARLSEMMESRKRSDMAFSMIQLLSVFCKEMAVTPQALKRMHEEWKRTYGDPDWYGPSGMDQFGRFSGQTHVILRQNWDKLLGHVDQAYARLLNQVKDKEAKLRCIRADIAHTWG
ncbi:hypothetical protein PG984_012292 [Apiospora sp. TS-2023a]